MRKCAMGGSDPGGRVAVCPPVVAYDQASRYRAAAELKLLHSVAPEVPHRTSR